MTQDAEPKALQPVEVDAQLSAMLDRYPLADGILDADMNQEEMAAALSTSVNTIGKWIRNEGMPVVEGGGPGRPYVLRLSHCFAWRMAVVEDERQRKEHNARQAARVQATFLNIDVEDPGAAMSTKDRKMAAEADILMNKARHMRRNLVEMHEVAELIESLMITAREGFQGFADTLERELGLTPPQVELVQRKANDALNKMADDIEQAELVERDVPEQEVQRQWTV